VVVAAKQARGTQSDLTILRGESVKEGGVVLEPGHQQRTAYWGQLALHDKQKLQVVILVFFFFFFFFF
jgi:hypothetical protein